MVDVGGQSVSAHDRLYLTDAMSTMVIWGDADPIIPVSHAHTAHEAIPGSRLEIMENTGHFPHVEHPKRFVEILEDFMETTEPLVAEPRDFREMLQEHSAEAV